MIGLNTSKRVVGMFQPIGNQYNSVPKRSSSATKLSVTIQTGLKFLTYNETMKNYCRNIPVDVKV